MRATRARNEAPARRDVLRLLLGGAGLVLAGCDGTTGLRRVHFTLYAGGPTAATGGSLSFRTAAGWDVVLTTAQLAVGPVYFNVAPPLTQRLKDQGKDNERKRLDRRLSDVLIRSARADETASHNAGGRIIAQVTDRIVVEALDPQLVLLGAGSGVNEHALSAEIWLLPQAPTGPVLAGGVAAVVRGVAQKDGLSVPFLARLPLDESMAKGQTLQTLRAAQRVRADLDFSTIPDGAAVALRVDPRPWLQSVDFALLRERPLEDGAHVAAPDDQLMRELLAGVRRSRDVYSLTLLSAP